MIKKIIKVILLILLVVVLIIAPISASDLELEIKEHYYNNGKEIIFYGNESWDGISFEIIGKNNLDTRVLYLSIINAIPDVFLSSFPNETSSLRIKQEKVIFQSKIISIDDLNNGVENFSIDIIGLNENENIPINASTTKYINIKKEDNLFMEIGKEISPSQPFLGFVLFIVLCLFLIFVVWYRSLFKKISNWRTNKQKEKEI